MSATAGSRRALNDRGLPKKLLNALSIVLACKNTNEGWMRGWKYNALRRVCRAFRELYDQTAVRELNIRSMAAGHNDRIFDDDCLYHHRKRYGQL